MDSNTPIVKLPLELVDGLATMLGTDSMTPEEKQELAQKVNEIIEQRVMMTVMSRLSEADQNLFLSLTTDSEIDQFFADRNIDLMAIAVMEAQAFRERVLGDLAYADGKLSDAS